MNAKRTFAAIILLLLLLVSWGGWRMVGPRSRSGSGGDKKDVVATLAEVVRGVQHRDRAALGWGDATPMMPLSDGDKIRTLDRSTAKVRFLEGSELLVEERSLITIRVPKDQGGLLMADIEIDDGQVRTSLARSADGKDRTLTIRSGGKTIAEISTTGSATGFADVSVVMRPDRSSRIVMHKGSGRVVSMGKTITLEEGTAMTASTETGTVSAPAAVVLPDAPVASEPPSGAQIALAATTSGGPATVKLAWAGVPAATRYTVEVARDAAFTDVVTKEELAGTDFSFATSDEGDFHWRVLTIDSNQTAGAPSAARTFRVIRPVAPTPTPTPIPTRTPVAKKTPRLPPPADVLEGEVGVPLVVTGSIKKGVRMVTVNGVAARVKGGTYEVSLSNLKAGKRVLVIEKIHEDGTVSHEKKEALIR